MDKKFQIQIMSIDPNDDDGREEGDDHQKYGLTVTAPNKEKAEEKAKERFKLSHGDLPIFWIKSFEIN